MKLLLTICLLPLQLLAQDITGIWTGFLHTEGNKLPYELAISGNNEKLTGYSMTIFTFNGKDNIGVKSIKLKRKSKNIALEDDEMVFNNYTTPPKRVKLYGDLFLKTEDTTLVLTGTFSTRTLDLRSQDKSPFTGTIELKKKNNFVATRLISKLDELNLLNALSFVSPKGIDQTIVAATSPPEALPSLKEKESTLASTPALNQQATAGLAKPEAAPTSTLTSTAPDAAPPQVARDKQMPVDSRIAAGRKQTAIVPAKQGQLPASTLTLTTPEQAPPQVEKEKQLSSSPGIASTAATDIKLATTTSATPKKTVAVPPSLNGSLPAPPAAALAERKTEVIRNIPFTSDSLILSLYDNGQVDGDTVSVVLNGKVIIAKKGLTTNAIRTTVYITPDMGDSLQLIMYAENLGSIPPNTGLLIVQDGDQRNEIRFAGDMQKSSAVILRRKR